MVFLAKLWSCRLWFLLGFEGKPLSTGRLTDRGQREVKFVVLIYLCIGRSPCKTSLSESLTHPLGHGKLEKTNYTVTVHGRWSVSLRQIHALKYHGTIWSYYPLSYALSQHVGSITSVTLCISCFTILCKASFSPLPSSQPSHIPQVVYAPWVCRNIWTCNTASW